MRFLAGRNLYNQGGVGQGGVKNLLTVTVTSTHNTASQSPVCPWIGFCKNMIHYSVEMTKPCKYAGVHVGSHLTRSRFNMKHDLPRIL